MSAVPRSRTRPSHGDRASDAVEDAQADAGLGAALDADVSGIALDGRCFAYVFPCQWEDHCKIGFSRDPLDRIAALHPRWFDFFCLERGALVQAESVRDARDLELELRAGLRAHNAPPPSAVRVQAGGGSEWFRGIEAAMQARVQALAARGYRTWPLHAWLRAALARRRDGLHEWSLAQLHVDELEGRTGPTPAQRRLRDALDAFAALDLAPEPCLPAAVLAWYRRG